MAAVNERQRRFAQYKHDVQERGKPFYPHAMFHDTVMSLVVVSVIIALACIWYFTSGEKPGDSGWLGPRYADRADPGTTSFIPRPDWYFFFLFYLLRIFKWPESVILATVGIPTIALIILLMVPFLDLRRERRPLRRPVAVVGGILVILSMGVLTYKGATAREALGAESAQFVDVWVQKNNLPASARPGATLFAESGCMQCHTYLGAGSANLGAPDLTAIGASNQGADFFARYVGDPRKFGNNVMPVFNESLSQKQLHDIGVFLNASKGGGG